MKFNWGTGIVIFITQFVVSMSAMVFKASQQNVDLVTEDYYEKELAFQGLKDKQALVLNHFKEQISYKIAIELSKRSRRRENRQYCFL